jgi:pyroglutamyl-peptidase
MPILLTAFEPYGEWQRNSSWDALVNWLSRNGGDPRVVTRKYPVNLAQLKARLDRDLSQGIDAVLHLGQAPGIAAIQLETVALNVAGMVEVPGEDYGPILEGAPIAYRTKLPIGSWAEDLRKASIPTRLSYHAGTYLCNAAMYLSHHWFASRGEEALVGFAHLPLTPQQVSEQGLSYPSLPLDQSSSAIGMLVERVMNECQLRSSSDSSRTPTQTA